MWILRKLTNNGSEAVNYLVSEKKCYSLGRKNCDIILSEDSSISRSHCMINIAKKDECPFAIQTITGVWIIDKKSKYGTYIKRNDIWVKMEEEQAHVLYNGTTIRFGVIDNIWRLDFKPMFACLSRILNEEKEVLKMLVEKVDGELYSNWENETTILFVNEITLTVKVLKALIKGVPIVTPDYLKEFNNCVKKNVALPEYRDFRPKIVESTLVPHLVILDHKIHRMGLFKGKKFFIPTDEQLESLTEIITAAGGSAELLQLSGNWHDYASENTIVIQLPCSKIVNPDENANNFKMFADLLKSKHNVRVVPENEIFQAIAYSSIEKYCNPKSLVFEIRKSPKDDSALGDVIVEDTPSESHVEKVAAEYGTCSSEEIESSTIISLDKCNSSGSRGNKRTHSPEVPHRQSKRLAQKNVNEHEMLNTYALNYTKRNSDVDVEEKPTTPKSAEQDKISNHFRTLIISKRDSLKYKNEEQPTTSEGTCDDQIPLAHRNRERKMTDFFSKKSKNERVELEKRKYCDSFDCVNDNLPEGKKKRITRGKNDFQHIIKPDDAVRCEEKDKISNKIARTQITNNSDTSKLNNKDHIELDGWIMRKTPYNYKENEVECHGTQSFKIFKKKLKYQYPQIVQLSEEECDQISRALLKDGWHQSGTYEERKSLLP